MASIYFLFLLLILIPVLIVIILTIIILKPRLIEISIKGHHVFITGGSSGFGYALAHEAASQGARVSILARNVAKLEEARNYIRLSTGIDVSTFSVDVRNFDDVKTAIDQADPIDVLICNQGVFIPEEFVKQELDTIKFMMDVNLMGTFHLIKAVLPRMKSITDRGPYSIGLMSSQAGQVGIYGYVAYAASKFGLRGLAESLQQEVISDNIHISLIFPPDTETPGLAEENKIRPEINSIIAASSSAKKADEVAITALNGIKSGSFIIPCNFDGLLLSLATAGMSLQKSHAMALLEVASTSILRFVGFFYLWSWYANIEKWNAQNKLTIGT